MSSLLNFQPSDALPPPVNPLMDYRRVFSNLENKDGFGQSVYAKPYTTRLDFLPFGKNERGVGLAVPQALLNMYDATFGNIGKALSGQLGVPSINNPIFTGAVADMGANIAGGGLLGSKLLPNAVPENSLGIFAGQKATNFPAKSLLTDVDKTKINQLREEKKQLLDELYSPDYANLSQKEKGILNKKELDLSERTRIAEKDLLDQEKNRTKLIDDFMERQDYRKGLENPSSRFYGSQREFGTGLFKMPDGKYRFEIDDRKASLNDLPNPTSYSDALELTKDNFPNLSGFDIVKKALPTQKLNTIIKHDELFKSYPQLKDTKVAFVDNYPYLGGYYPKENFIIVNSGKISKDFGNDKAKDRIMSTLLHEIQHNVQDIENFASGTNKTSALQNLANNIKDAGIKKDNSYQGYYNYIKANAERNLVNQAIRLLDLKKKSIQGSQPRFLFNQNDWYKYGDQIRREVTEELGYSYPKTKSAKRDAWQKKAYEKLYNINEKQSVHARKFLDRSPKDLKNLSNRLERIMDNNFKDKLTYDSQSKRLKALTKMSESDNFSTLSYLNKLGEVEARIVEARSGFDPSFKDEMYRPTNPYDNLERGLFEYSSPSELNLKSLLIGNDDMGMFERGQGLLIKD